MLSHKPPTCVSSLLLLGSEGIIRHRIFVVLPVAIPNTTVEIGRIAVTSSRYNSLVVVIGTQA